MLLLSLAIALVVLLVTWRRPVDGIALVVLLWPAYLLRTTIQGIPTTALELAIYGLVAGFVLSAIRTRRLIWPKLPKWYHLFGALWILAWVLATLFSTDRQASLGALKAWLIDPMLFGAVVLVAVQTVQQRTMLVKAMSLSGAIVAVAGLAQLIGWRESLQDGRLSSFFHPVANYAAMYLGPILILTVGALLWKLLHPRWWVAAGLMTIALALTVSFGGYVAVSVGLVVLWSRWENPVWKKRSLLLAVVAAALGLGILSQTSYLSEKFSTADRSSSLVRSQIWRTSIEMIKEHPIFGVGPNAYEAEYRATIPKLYFPPLEWLVSQPHQLYLALWLETGLLGLIIFFFWLVFWLRSIWPQVKNRQTIATISLAAMVTILVHGLVDTPLFKNDLILIVLMVVILPLLRIEAEPHGAE